MTETNEHVLNLTADIVSAFLSTNPTRADELPTLIGVVHGTLASLASGGTAAAQEPAAALVPAVPVKKSVTPDYLVCLEDGKKFKMLRRHLKTVYGMTPEQYRAKWGLPASYPMAAPNYSQHRSELAKASGLGTKQAA